MADTPTPPQAPPTPLQNDVTTAVDAMMQNAPPTPKQAPTSAAAKGPPTPSRPEPVQHHRDGEPPPDSAPLSKMVRYWIWKYVGTLVMEERADGEYVMSLGRVSTAALLAQAMWRWGVGGGDIPQSMLQTLWILLGYLLGTKGISLAGQWVKPAETPTYAPDKQAQP